MRNKIKRIIAALMVSALLVSGAGCSGNNESPSTETAAPEGSDTVTSAETSAAPEIVQESYEYEQELNIIDDNYRNYYEIFVRSFCDSDGDGIGDLNGVVSKLDYIQEMGFNGIWLMPVNPSTTYHKYDVKDYYSIDPEYGTLDDFKALLDECEKRNIKLIMDLVFNHTSAKHEWFTQAINYLKNLGDGEINIDDCKYAGYYNFSKESKGSGWCPVSGTDWFYEGKFWDQMPDLNLDNPEVRSEIEQIAKYWLEMGVGGFRLDAVKEFFSGAPAKNTEVLEWFCGYVKGVEPDAYVVGEVWENMMTIADYYKSGIDSLFDFPVSQHSGNIIKMARGINAAGSTMPGLMKTISETYSSGNPDFIDAPFVSNHDTGRIANACGNNETQMKLAAGLLLTMNGSPFVYYGEEIGLNSHGEKDENKRLPMNWSASDTAGMTKKPQDADEVEQKHAPLDEQLSDPLSIVNYYKRAVRIRNENPEIARGAVEVIDTGSEFVSGVRKTWSGSSIEIYYNLTDTSQNISVEKEIRGYLTTDGSAAAISGGELTLPPYSIVICR